jgi:CRP-like cAMP-binding protein
MPPTLMPRLDPALVAALPPFRGMTRPDIAAVLEGAVSRRHEEATEFFREGEPAERFFLLLDGAVRVVRTTPHGEQVIALHIPPGQLFGIAPALGHERYPATAVAAVESLALSWPRSAWGGLIARHPGFASETWRTVGARMGEMQDRVIELATQAVESRVAAALLRMVNQSGRRTEEGIEITFPVTRQNIAELAGTTLHSVSRLLAAWEREGIVRSTRRHVTVTAPHRLVLLSGAGGEGPGEVG